MQQTVAHMVSVMSRYIDADALIAKMPTVMDMQDVYLPIHFKEWLIDEAPSIDIEPKRGEWIVHKERAEVKDGFIDFFPTKYECSNCGLKQSMYFINSKPSNFCPNCGADMREREGE